MKTKPSVIAIVGVTASGKSDLAVHIAKKFSGEVISADSRQVYRGLDIGTGKISHKKMMGIPHHLLDVADPKVRFTVANYQNLALKALEHTAVKKKLPIIVGGSGFYIDALLFSTQLPEVVSNPKLRAKLQKKTPEELLGRLKKIDPRRAAELDPHNKVRIIRAIEIAEVLGRVPKVKNKRSYEILFIGLQPKPEVLRKKIHSRLQKRMRIGMIEEAKRLHRKGLSYKRMYELGLEYKYLALHLEKKISKEKLVSELETAIWQYGRRQTTWFKRNKNIHWFDPDDKKTKNKVEKLVRGFLSGNPVKKMSP